MKAILKNMVTLCIVLGCGACKPSGESNINVVSILVDMTSEEHSVPDYERVKASLGLSDASRGALYKITAISDVDYAPVVRYEIRQEATLLQNPGGRKRDIEDFLSGVKMSLDSFQQVEGDRPQSSVYRRVALVLNDLSVQKGKSKTLYVCSDLVENGELNFYGESDLRMLYTEPAKIRELFASWEPLGALSNVTVVFCYTPKDWKDSKRYSALLKIYSSLLVEKGGAVQIDGFDNLVKRDR